MPEGARLRRLLVDDLERRGLIRSEPVRRAFLAVPRERFVPEAAAAGGLEAVYRDEAIATRTDGAGMALSSSSQPAIMVEMLERLDVAAGMRVLEIGAGTGYNAALLAELVGREGRVVSVELDPGTAARAGRALRSAGFHAQVVTGDGRDGWAAGAPYDRIVVTASTAEIPGSWLEQLRDCGLLEAPLRLRGFGGLQAIGTLARRGDELRSVAVVCGAFMPIRIEPDGYGPEATPALCALTREGGSQTPLVELFGDGVARLSAVARRRLLALALGAPRVRRLRRVDGEGFGLYLSVHAPRRRLAVGLGGFGLFARNGRSLALLPFGDRVDRLHAWGGRDAEESLLALVDEWRLRGSPGADDLEIRVGFRNGSSTIRHRFRAH